MSKKLALAWRRLVAVAAALALLGSGGGCAAPAGEKGSADLKGEPAPEVTPAPAAHVEAAAAPVEKKADAERPAPPTAASRDTRDAAARPAEPPPPAPKPATPPQETRPALRELGGPEEGLEEADQPKASQPVAVLIEIRREGHDDAGETTRTWQGQLSAFTQRSRVVGLPLPIPASPSASDRERAVALASETLQRRGLSQYDLAGYGEGAVVALELAARSPESVERLILVDLPPAALATVNDQGGDDVGEGDAAAPPSAPRSIDPRLEKLTMPVLVVFRASLMAVRSASQYMKETGFDTVEQIRVHRIDAADPILQAAAEDIARRIDRFLVDTASGRELTKAERVHLESGLSYIDQTVGDGPTPTPGQTVTVRYRWKLKDGTDVTPCGGFPLKRSFALDDSLLPGLREGLSTMRVGGKRKLILPPKLAYRGKGDEGKIPPDALLMMDVILLEVSDAESPPKPSFNESQARVVNDHVKVIDRKAGEGAEVTEDSIVTFEYRLWGPSGHLVRSTAPGRPKRGVLRDINEEAKVWLPGMLGMKVDGERLIIGDAEYTFGDKLMPGICAGADVVFRVKVLEAEPLGPKPTLTPVSDDQYTQIRPGLMYYDIRPGRGTSPTQESAIVVHYAFWSEKYKSDPDACLDSSRMRREPFVLPLSMCPQSWKDCLPSMRVGGQRQMKLQYDGVERAGVQKGDWVIYEFELLDVLTREQYDEWRKSPNAYRRWRDK